MSDNNELNIKIGNTSVTVKSALVAICLLALFAMSFSLTVKTEIDNKLSKSIESVENNAAGSLDKGQKLCRVLQAETWRDGIIVPKNWTIFLCMDYMTKTDAHDYQLGCIYEDGITLGTAGGGIPYPNCGWK
jgi:hypothetical protein